MYILHLYKAYQLPITTHVECVVLIERR